MNFQVGDKVIHRTYGLGEIVEIEKKVIRDHPTDCYVVLTSNLMIWVPIDDPSQNSLRTPAMPDEFTGYFAILTAPGEELLEDRLLRRDQLMNQLKDGQLGSICRVVRDLTHFKRRKKLNDQEKAILERAQNSLLAEWTYSLGVTPDQAQQAMTQLLDQ